MNPHSEPPGILWGARVRKYRSTIQIGAVYCLLLAGGFWHLLGVFQPAMRGLAGPVILLLGGVIILEYADTITATRRPVFLVWTVCVLAAGYLVEWIGTHTGAIFGRYAYGETLQPMLAGVPVAMSFAWAGMLLASYGVANWVLGNRMPGWLLRALITAAAMVVFDLLLEQVAVSLHYWHWLGDGVPLRNYAAWFLMSFIAAGFGSRYRAFPAKAPALAKHFYLAQILYFGLVLLK